MHTTNFNELSNAIVGKHPFEWLVYGEESITAADTCNDDNFTANWRNDPRGCHYHNRWRHKVVGRQAVETQVRC